MPFIENTDIDMTQITIDLCYDADELVDALESHLRFCDSMEKSGKNTEAYRVWRKKFVKFKEALEVFEKVRQENVFRAFKYVKEES